MGVNAARPVLLVACTALLAGCTPMQWVRADADAAQKSRDLAECGREAWLRSLDRQLDWYRMPPIAVRDAQGRVFFVQPRPPFYSQFEIESTLARRCMYARGYELVPLEEKK
jgi:hypothetical protein